MRLSARPWLLLAVVNLAFARAAAVAAGPAPVAIVHAGPALLEWAPAVESAGIVLSIADPRGVVRTVHFAAGEAPSLPLFDERGAPLPDGTYTWEIRLAPRAPRTAHLVQSGSFTVSDGGVVSPDLVEDEPRAMTDADQMVPDDLIVDGKGCIGLGCSNNEPFGQESLRLKQSVVRLRFDDTSSQGGFPAHDWQLAANDSASGGANRFSIEDLTAGTAPLTVRGGAPNSSLYIDGLGSVGLGTATPAAQLHVTSASGGKALFENTNPAVAPREMFEARNKGGAAVIFDDTNDPSRWANTAAGPNFLFNNQANPGVEFTFGPTGNLTIAGNLTAANFPASSNEMKKALADLQDLRTLLEEQRRVIERLEERLARLEGKR